MLGQCVIFNIVVRIGVCLRGHRHEACVVSQLRAILAGDARCQRVHLLVIRLRLDPEHTAPIVLNQHVEGRIPRKTHTT